MTDPDEAGVDAPGRVLHCALEQQVRLCARCDVRLDRAEIVHLSAVREVEGRLLRRGTLPIGHGLGPHTGVVPAEGHRRQRHVAVAVRPGELVPDQPHIRAEFVDRDVLHPRSRTGVNLDHRGDECSARGVAAEPLDHRDLAVGRCMDHEARERDLSLADRMLNHDRHLEHLTADRAQHDRLAEGCVPLGKHVGGRRHGVRLEGFGQTLAGAADRRCGGRVGVAVEIEFVDPAVPPDLLVHLGHR
ncbi:unannotated protein [freshwater metagenome]|uniref:Unannotated protein n=1 Tax=freshwater metagenome TaxID=449393 RepID=A0A6J6ZFK5_9ZZZZ